MALETSVIPVISTGHLTEEVNKQLLGKHNPWSVHAILPGCGFFLFLDELAEANEPVPQCLKDIRDWLRLKETAGVVDNSRWVRLDSDANTVDELPFYDW